MSGTANQGSHLVGAGSSAVFPLFIKMFDDYRARTLVEVNYQSVGSGAGVEQLIKRTVDFGATDVPLTTEQAEAVGDSVLHIPVTILAVAIVYNLANVVGLRLDAETLSAIYLGAIRKWDDPRLANLNPGLDLPDTDIVVVERADGSGTTAILTTYLSQASRDWANRVGAGTSVKWPTGIAAKGSEGLAGVVQKTPGALGYVEFAYAVRTDLGIAAVKNRVAAFISPSLESAGAAAAAVAVPADGRGLLVNAQGNETYPLAGFSWLIAYQRQADSKKGDALRRLFSYMVETGQAFAVPLGYAPLPDSVRAVDAQIIASMTVPRGTPGP